VRASSASVNGRVGPSVIALSWALAPRSMSRHRATTWRSPVAATTLPWPRMRPAGAGPSARASERPCAMFLTSKLVLVPNSSAMSHTGTPSPNIRDALIVARSRTDREMLNGRMDIAWL
jgi:hypothetical protein